jgi:uncharacterized protein
MATLQQYAAQLLSDEAKQCLVPVRSGNLINPFSPKPALIDIKDIAFGLASISRYAGQQRLTVAQHCCHMADMMLTHKETECFAFDALMHEAPSYLLGDVVSPVKRLPEYELHRALYDHVGQIIALRFRFGWPLPPEVIVADLRMRYTEMRDLFKRAPLPDDNHQPFNLRIKVWSRHAAEYGFMQRFERLAPTAVKRG